MKGVIVEVRKGYAIALKESGQFVKVRHNGSYKIGYEYDLTSFKSETIRRFSKIASIAATFLMVLGISYGVYSYSTPYSYVDIDINPNIELAVNKYDRIIGSKAYNEDGKDILEKVDFNNKKLKAGVEIILDSAIEQGYLGQDTENKVVFTVSSKDNKRVQKIEDDVKVLMDNKREKSDVDTEVIIEKINLGKQNDDDEVEDDNELETNELRDKAVKDVLKPTKEEKNNDKKIDSEEKAEEKKIKEAEKSKEKLKKKEEKAKEKADKEFEKAKEKADKEFGKAKEKTDKEFEKANDKIEKEFEKAKERIEKIFEKAKEKKGKKK